MQNLIKRSKCEIKGCQGKARTRGLGAKHYIRLLRQGDPEKHGKSSRPAKHDPYMEMANLVGAGEWSPRTVGRLRRGVRILSDCSAPARTVLLKACARPNGSIVWVASG
jgi:hypothetical protein